MRTRERKAYYGKYLGVVTDNRDPLMKGRLRARVPDVKGDNESSWALPSVPYGGNGVGWFMIPPVDALVWIEFENGHWDHPIWSGCFWDDGQTPASPAVAEMKVLKTDNCTLTLDDTPGTGGITIETSGGQKIVLNSQGIEITNGQGASIKLSGPTVKINGEALEVT
jgi:uncharacterized protein involved in type VI secretion and phage assembly